MTVISDFANLRRGLITLSLATIIVATQSHALASSRPYPAGAPAFMTPAADNVRIPIAFVSDDNTNAVYLFNADTFSPQPLGKITDGIDMPFGLAVDPSGNLYVANSNRLAHTSSVAVYHPGSLHPFRTIKSDLGFPVLVAVGADNTLAIGYNPQQSIFSPAALVIYDKGSPNPTRTIAIGLNSEDTVHLIGLSIDAAEDVILSVGRYPRGGQLLKFAPGSLQGQDVGIIPGSGGAFDAAGNFYMSYTAVINEFAPGATQPFRQISKGITAATLIAVSPDGTLFANNASQFDNPGFEVKFAPNRSRPIGKIQNENDISPTAVALRPALR